MADTSSLCELRRTQEGGIGLALPNLFEIILWMPHLQSRSLLPSNFVLIPTFGFAKLFVGLRPMAEREGLGYELG